MVQTVRFDTKDDLLRFSELASKQDFNIYISTPTAQLDAKSVLALLTMMGQDVTIVAPDHADAAQFKSFLDKYNDN